MAYSTPTTGKLLLSNKKKQPKKKQQEHYLAKQSPGPTPIRIINTEKFLSNPHSTSMKEL
jgi:hypothetical protein